MGSALIQWHHGDADFRVMIAPSQNHPTQWRDIGEIPAPGQGDVFECRLYVVGRVKIDPAQHRTKHRNPGMRRVRADQPGLARAVAESADNR